MYTSVMDLAAWQHLFVASDNPCLPSAALAQGALWLAWALLLGAGVVWLGDRRKAALRWPAAWLMMGWTLLAGFWLPAWSPAYWLGLAFQSPSLTSGLLGLIYLLRQSGWRQHQRLVQAPQPDLQGQTGPGAWQVLAGAGVVLGWVLLADMLAGWPVSIYAWGFSPAALACAWTLVALFWLVWGARRGGHRAMALMALVLLLFVTTRLPSGNVWDAVLDPWLWIALQVHALRRIWRRLGRLINVKAATRV